MMRARIYMAFLTTASIALLLLLYAMRDFIWSVIFADIIVIIATLGAFFILIWRARSRTDQSAQSPLSPEGLTIIATALVLFVTYATFRNQSKLAAEATLNSEGHALFELEMNNPELRCLYGAYGFDDADKCLIENMKSPGRWSAAIFYVEESLWLLEKAESDRRVWGSPYSKDIGYWRDYINHDPTGVFSYYLVSNHGSLAEAQKAMRASGVEIPTLYAKYLRVRQALARVNANPPPLIGCP